LLPTTTDVSIAINVQLISVIRVQMQMNICVLKDEKKTNHVAETYQMFLAQFPKKLTCQ